MSETERVEALKAIQLELFQLRREYLLRVKDLKARRKFLLLHGRNQKRCRKCNEMMDAEQFYRDRQFADGLYPWCRECCAKRDKERYKRKRNVLVSQVCEAA